MNIAQDKLMHFVAGLVIAIVVIVLGFSPALAGAAAVAAGFGKEMVWDLMLKKGRPEWADAVWTSVAGCLVAAGAYFQG